MANQTEPEIDLSQVKKAVQALQAFMKTQTTSDSLLLEDSQPISLLFTMLKIPRQAQTIRIPLPHAQRGDSEEVCLFTRDEPNMTPDQTQRFYKKLLEERGVKNISEIIPYKVLKTEYKPYEAKRRLLGNFDLFLSDDRVRRLLPSHLGKHFYERKREPLAVNLQSKNLAVNIQSVIQGTNIKINNKGSCCMVRVAHSGMAADEVTANIEAAVKTVAAKLRTKGPVFKIIHIKTQSSVALPIYTADLTQFSTLKKKKKSKKPGSQDDKDSEATNQEEEKKAQETSPPAEKKKVKKNKTEEEEEEEEIPQLVPIETPTKKPKLEKPVKKKQLEKAPKPAEKKQRKPQNKLSKKAGKMENKMKRRVPKVK